MLIQPFHCIIYVAFSTIIISILESPTNSLGSGLLVIIIMIFMRQAETIIRTIFGFGNAKSLGDVVAAGALVAGSVSAASKTLGALKSAKSGSSGGNKGGNSSSGGADKKPNLKDTSSTGGAQKPSSGSQAKNEQQSNSNNAGGSNTPSGESNSGSSSSSDNSQSSSSDTSSGTNNSTTDTSSGDSSSNDTVSTVDRNYNTEAVKDAESKFKDVLSKYASFNVKGLEIAAGIGIGGAMGGDVSSMIAGGNFASAAVNASKIGGQKVISGFRKTPIAKNSRINKKTDKVIDAYDNLKAEKGWSDDRMLDETERLLDVKDTSKIKNEKLREYAETIQDLRTEYEGEYQAPNDMVLDRVSKVQSGGVKKNNSKKYTKKPKTRPIDRRSRRQKPNGQNGK